MVELCVCGGWFNFVKFVEEASRTVQVNTLLLD